MILPLAGSESALVTGGARDTGAYQRLCFGGEERSRARHLLIRVVLQRSSQIATAVAKRRHCGEVLVLNKAYEIA
jgi:hypothetical protein